ncbi:uncharacterized protein Fot_37421 [Forsythia ovata]|uniref:Uncharacterized protein n=1 Tax=Forsythia ovata TaxID=205694 RepID=A0ABD1S0C6_9LAMI
MAEQTGTPGKPREKPKIIVPHLCLNEMANPSHLSTSIPSSPVQLRKTSSVTYNCLCSPTTHAGSFRCRYHRNTSLTRNSMSVGTKLSELAGKSPNMCEALGHSHLIAGQKQDS